MAETANGQVDIQVVDGDLLEQPVEVIVNPWNRNPLPWWLLLPQGVSGAIKKRGGIEPFRELSRCGMIPLGGAVLTGAGRLDYRGMIHVAGINLMWRASERSIRQSVRSALAICERESFQSIAFPAIGAGSGGFNESASIEMIVDQASQSGTTTKVVVVRYRPVR